MGQSTIKNSRRIFTTSGGDPSLPDRVIYLENNEYKILYFQSISAATGTITKPTNSTILLDQFYEGGDAIVETLINGQPSEQSPVTAGGAVVSVSSFDTNGNYTLSGTPSSYPVALVYILKIKAVDYQNLVTANIMAMDEVSPVSQTITNGVTDKAPSEDAVFDALALKLDANNAAVTNARNRKYFAYDNTSYSYTGTTANTIVRTIPIEIGDMLENSTLSLMMNFFKIGTNNTFSMFLYITTNSSAATGGTQIGANGTGAPGSLQFGKHFRLTNKNSLTSQLGQTSGNNADDFYTILNGAKQVLTIDFTVKQYLHIVMKANSALDTIGISDYQCYIDKE